MKIGFVVYDGLTALDFVGVYDPVTRLRTMGFRESIEWDVCGLSPEVTATGGLTFETTVTEEPLNRYDLVVVPGGIGTSLPKGDHPLVRWLRTAEDCRYKTSVCTGALLLAAAGLIDGHRVTTHPSAYDALANRATVTDRRVVRDGDVITARGVTSALDIGLYLCELLADAETRDRIAAQMDYPHDRDYAGGD